jgi:hypothetical protein
MKAFDPLLWHILDATADDWESIVQIEDHITRFLGRSSRFKIASTLKELLEQGLIEEMKNQTFTPDNLVNNPDEFWFAMTEEGRMIWDFGGSKNRCPAENQNLR